MTSLRFAVIYLLALAVFAMSPGSWASGNSIMKNTQTFVINNK